jgi:hypothetical protein
MLEWLFLEGIDHAKGGKRDELDGGRINVTEKYKFTQRMKKYPGIVL